MPNAILVDVKTKYMVAMLLLPGKKNFEINAACVNRRPTSSLLDIKIDTPNMPVLWNFRKFHDNSYLTQDEKLMTISLL